MALNTQGAILEKKDKAKKVRNPITDQEKLQIISRFILSSPPGELQEVINGIRKLLNNDRLLSQIIEQTVLQYDQKQLTPIKIDNSDFPVLITEHNYLHGSRFYDPRSKQSFVYDQFNKRASDYRSWDSEGALESWRAPLEYELDKYVEEHFVNGKSNVFAKRSSSAITLIACIEGHRYEGKNYCNGAWRSEWSATRASCSVEVTGTLRVDVHYYEDGNAQLNSSKEIKKCLLGTNKEQTAKELVAMFKESEGEYQTALTDNYELISGPIFKTLRRQLPVTRSKVNWDNIISNRSTTNQPTTFIKYM